MKAESGRDVAVFVGIHSFIITFVVCRQRKKAAFPERCPGSRKSKGWSATCILSQGVAQLQDLPTVSPVGGKFVLF